MYSSVLSKASAVLASRVEVANSADAAVYDTAAAASCASVFTA